MLQSKFVPLIFVGVGIFMLIQVIWPVFTYKVWESKLDGPSLISPQINKKNLEISLQTTDNFPAIVSFLKRSEKPAFDRMKISIPSIKIDSATAFIDSNDLSKGLAHLPGSALPGEKGNMFISGHSALPLFFSGDKNYGSIFANLPNVKKGDEILVFVGLTRYIYKVINIKTVDPSDLSVVEPPEPLGRYITLMTCVPPGLNSKRLIVLGQLD